MEQINVKNMAKMKVAILGAGNMGTALAHLIGTNGHEVNLWSIEPEVINDINIRHTNKKYLDGVILPANVFATLDLDKALLKAKVVVMAVPTQVLSSVLEQANKLLNKEMVFLSVSKGIEQKTGRTVSCVIKDNLSKDLQSHVGVLMGPLFATEIAQGLPSVSLVAIGNLNDYKILKKALSNDYFFTRYSADVLGAELGGALKNIYAILLGVCAGMGYGWNTKSATLSAAISEMAFCGQKLGAKKETLYGLSGLGDLLTTGFGEKSRNRRFGEKICTGETVDEALKEIGQVVEGVATLKIVAKMLKKYKKQTPLLNAVHDMVEHHKDPCAVFSKLLQKII